jgi:two-component system OmpR family response regulator
VRVLVVEDDEMVASFVSKGLQQAGFAVDHAADGEEALHLLSTEPYDAAVVDIMLPGLDGVSVVARLRQSGRRTPVIFLSAKRSVQEKVEGLQAGGDDYLVKPFAFSELLARLRALIRRSSGAEESTRLKVGDLEMDLLKHTAARAGRNLDLRPREFGILEYLMRNAGHVVSKTMIMEHVWDYNFDPQTNVVEANICRLRARINRGFDVELIRTMRGVGYVLDADSSP